MADTQRVSANLALNRRSIAEKRINVSAKSSGDAWLKSASEKATLVAKSSEKNLNSEVSVKDRCGYGAAGKVFVTGLLRRNGCVYTQA